jgi:hypothetical protein
MSEAVRLAAARAYDAVDLPPPQVVLATSPWDGAMLALQLQQRALEMAWGAWCDAAGGIEGPFTLDDLKVSLDGVGAHIFGAAAWREVTDRLDSELDPVRTAARRAEVERAARRQLPEVESRIAREVRDAALGVLFPDTRRQIVAQLEARGSTCTSDDVAAVVYERLGSYSREWKIRDGRNELWIESARALVRRPGASVLPEMRTWPRAIADGTRPFESARLGERVLALQVEALTAPVRDVLIPRSDVIRRGTWRMLHPVLEQSVRPACADPASAVYWWAFQDALVVAPPPVRYACDADGRLHSPDAMAITYPDGWGLFAWRGVRVEADAILHPETLTAERVLGERNIEVRRALIEIVGREALLTQANARVVDDDACGTLLALDVPRDEAIFALRVTCPSTGNVYFLRVPPGIRRAHHARAWTFDELPANFAPLVET